MALFFGSGRQILDSSDWTITVNANAGNLTAKTYYFSLQGANRSGFNRNLSSGIISVSNASSISITINPTAIKSGEYWDRFIIGIKTTSDGLFQELATVQYKDLANPVLNYPLPITVTFTEDTQLIPGLLVDSFPTTGLFNGRAVRNTSTGYIYRYQQYSNITTSVPPIVIVDSGNVWIATGALDNNVEDVEGVYGCNIDVNYVEDYTEFNIPIYEGDGTESEEVVYFLTNSSAQEYTAKGTVIDCYVFLNEEDKPTNLLRDKLILEPLGFVNLLTGEIRTSDGSKSFNQVGSEIFLGTEELFLEDDLQANEAYAVKVSLKFIKKDMAFLEGVPIRVDLDFSNFSASYLNSGGMFGEGVILAEKDFRRIVPNVGLSVTALEGSGVVNDYKFENVKPSIVSNLAVDTENQKLVINRVGEVYLEPMDFIETNSVLRASVSTISGESHLSAGSSININTSSQMLRISVDYPTVYVVDTVYGIVRGDYPDVIAGNNKAYFNPTVLRVYVDNGAEVRYWDMSVTPESESEVFYIENFATGALIDPLPVNPKFGLYNPPTQLLNMEAGGSLAIGTYDVYTSYIYTGNEVTNISHTNPVISGANTYTPIKELQSDGLVSIINDYNYYRQPYTLAELQALDVSGIQEGTEFKFKHDDGIFPVVLEKNNTETPDDFRVIQAQEGRFKNKSVPVGESKGTAIIGTYPDNIDLAPSGIVADQYAVGNALIDVDARGIIQDITYDLPDIAGDLYTNTAIEIDGSGNVRQAINSNLKTNSNIDSLAVVIYYYVESGLSGTSNTQIVTRLDGEVSGDTKFVGSGNIGEFYTVHSGCTTGIQTLRSTVTGNADLGYIAILDVIIGNVHIPLQNLSNNSNHIKTTGWELVTSSITTPRGRTIDAAHLKAVETGAKVAFQANITPPGIHYTPYADISPEVPKQLLTGDINTVITNPADGLTLVRGALSGNPGLPQGAPVTSNTSGTFSIYPENKLLDVQYLYFSAYYGNSSIIEITLSNLKFNGIDLDKDKAYVSLWTVSSNGLSKLNITSGSCSFTVHRLVCLAVVTWQYLPPNYLYTRNSLKRYLANNSLNNRGEIYLVGSSNEKGLNLKAGLDTSLIVDPTLVNSLNIQQYGNRLNKISTFIPLTYYTYRVNDTQTTCEVAINGTYYPVTRSLTLTRHQPMALVTEGTTYFSILAQTKTASTEQILFRGMRIGANILTGISDLVNVGGAVSSGTAPTISGGGDLGFNIPTLSENSFINYVGTLDVEKYPKDSTSTDTYPLTIDIKTSLANTHRFRVYVDDTNNVANPTGVNAWYTVTTYITDGWHYIALEYERNGDAIGGDNRVWISNVKVAGESYDLNTQLHKTAESSSYFSVNSSTILMDGSTGKAITANDSSLNNVNVAIYKFYVAPKPNTLYIPEKSTHSSTGSDSLALYNNGNKLFVRKENNALPYELLTEESLVANSMVNAKPGSILPRYNEWSKLKITYRHTSPNSTGTTRVLVNGGLIVQPWNSVTITYDQEFNLKPGTNTIYFEFTTTSNAVVGENIFELFALEIDGYQIKLDQLSNYNCVALSNFSWDWTDNCLKTNNNIPANGLGYIYIQLDSIHKALQTSRQVYYRDSEKNSQLNFYYKVNSVNSNNQFKFYVDDVLQFSQFNIPNWTLYASIVRPGIRKLRWEFDKRVTEADVFAEICSLCVGNHDWFDTNMPSISSNTPGHLTPVNNPWTTVYGAINTANLFYYYRSDQYVTRYNKSVFELVVHVPYHAEGGFRYYSTIPSNNQLNINPVANQVHRINIDKNVTIGIRDYSTPKEGDICTIYGYLSTASTVTFNWNFDLGNRKILNTIYSHFIASFVYVNSSYRLVSLEQKDYTTFWSITNESYENRPVYVREGTFTVPNLGSTSVIWHSISGLDKAIRCDAFMKNGAGTHKYVQTIEVNSSEVRFTDSRDNTGYTGHYRLYFTVT